MSVVLRWHTFGELGGGEIYEILALRQSVFVVEQRCAYLDADGRDRSSLHLCGRTAAGVLAAYLRLLPPGQKFAGPSIGRVITAPEFRGRGTGRALMEEGIRRAAELYPGIPLTLAAQIHLEGFYRSLGFIRSGMPYDEDGIPHVTMMRPPALR
jgi:ElaA protein